MFLGEFGLVWSMSDNMGTDPALPCTDNVNGAGFNVPGKREANSMY